MFKSSLRYGLYFFAGLWMFGLGVMVGRGTSPVTFDTREFQARLEAIAREHGSREKVEQTVDLKFYDVLNRPAEQAIKFKKAGEILPKRDPAPEAGQAAGADGVPVKLSKKMASLNTELLAAYRDRQTRRPPAPPEPEKIKARKIESKPDPAAGQKKKKASPVAKGDYTIQVAAFKVAKDAVSEMARLQKKGVAVYRVEGERNGIVWHRIRTGNFPDYKAAQSALEKLKAAKIKGMIIKKE